MNLTQNIETPCISYMERNNYIDSNGDTIGYSHIQYQVKVWGNSIASLQGYAVQIDNALRQLGFRRISSGEIYDINSTMIQKVLIYDALALENYT